MDSFTALRLTKTFGTKWLHYLRWEIVCENHISTTLTQRLIFSGGVIYHHAREGVPSELMFLIIHKQFFQWWEKLLKERSDFHEFLKFWTLIIIVSVNRSFHLYYIFGQINIVPKLWYPRRTISNETVKFEKYCETMLER